MDFPAMVFPSDFLRGLPLQIVVTSLHGSHMERPIPDIALFWRVLIERIETNLSELRSKMCSNGQLSFDGNLHAVVVTVVDPKTTRFL